MGKCPEKLLARLALSPWPPLFGPFRIILLRHSLICAKFVLSCFSHVPLFATPWTVAHQAPLSTEISRGKNTGVSCHSLLRGSSRPRNRTHDSYLWWWEGSLPLAPPGKPTNPAHIFECSYTLSSVLGYY